MKPARHSAKTAFATILFGLALMTGPICGPARAESGVTIDGVIKLPDYSASSQDGAYSNGPISSGVTVDGRPVGAQSGQFFSSSSAQGPTIYRDLDALPAPVWQMVMALLDASQAESLEALRGPIEMNEMPPSFGATDPDIIDPIKQLRSLSESAEDGEILAALNAILQSGFVLTGIGTPYEAYVWPYFAYYDIPSLNMAQRDELLQLLPQTALEQSLRSGQYSYFQLGISPDGVWQYFFKQQ
ncbi:hypothetical protein [uncultured Cohaesibacter sp.]|uniref:hypothetical protein n=1 Tax=uncultured Cohaesibacter sp. TaxID=1002546 RepID=UPI0029C98943|nr:hypothetical protein [uncultured Cohaesibacter sp.]